MPNCFQNRNTKPSVGTIIRTVVLAVALINNILVMSGKSPLPIEDETIEELLSIIFTTGAALVSWWKNNSFTKEAIMADGYKELLKDEGDQ